MILLYFVNRVNFINRYFKFKLILHFSNHLHLVVIYYIFIGIVDFIFAI